MTCQCLKNRSIRGSCAAQIDVRAAVDKRFVLFVLI